MSSPTSESIYQALSDIRLIDPHTHINPHDPASHTLADLLGYHYYTELAHSAGMPKAHIEERGISPKELVSRLVPWLPTIENTAQYRWLVELCRNFYGFAGDRIDASNWEELYDIAEDRMRAADWANVVLEQSNVEAVFLTNDFDDELSGFDTDVYIPCLRTDELVFHLSKKQVQQRLEQATGVDLDGSLSSLREALTRRFEHFVSRGARACAISLPPGFTPSQVADGRAATALDDVLTRNEQADPANRDALSRRVFWTLAELCDQFGLPFDLMIGVNRGVYAGGVYQGQDLYDSRVSLIQYRDLFNAFPGVKFPISVLASVTNQELVSYAWIFPNVITNGHWWYSNTPSFIARDAAVRLEAVPQTKQIAYYSDAYKLEFVWPKFDMYRRTLANLLASHFVQGNGWSEERAVELGRQVLRTNVDEIFPRPDTSKIRPSSEPVVPVALDHETIDDDSFETIETPMTKPNPIAEITGAAGAALASHEFFGPEADDSSDSEDAESTYFDENETFTETATVVDTFDNIDAGSTPSNPDAAADPETTEVVDPARNELDSSPLDSSDPESEWETVGDVEGFELSPSDAADDSFDTLIQEQLGDDPATAEEPLELEADDDISSSLETVIENGDDVNLDDVTLVEDDLDDVTLVEDDLDVVPNDDEVQALPVDDVVLSDYAAQLVGLDAEKLEAEVDDEPLDVGDLTGEDSEAADTTPEIRMLRGEESFIPDEDSLQMTSDPSTGELVFPVDTNSDAGSLDETPQLDETLDNVDEWEIDEDQIEEVIGKTDDSQSPDASSTATLDDDDWFADLSDLMGDGSSKPNSPQDDNK